jgi:hypothetical protein
MLNCIDATKTGDITKSGKIWSYDKIHRSLSTVSITPDGLLFVGDFSGFVHCLDADTGEVYWVHDMKAHMWGSTLVADGKVYCGDEDGDLVVFAAKGKENSECDESGRPNLFDASGGQRRSLCAFQHAPCSPFTILNTSAWPATKNQGELELDKPANK